LFALCEVLGVLPSDCTTLLLLLPPPQAVIIATARQATIVATFLKKFTFVIFDTYYL
jgi:hypothetical protein